METDRKAGFSHNRSGHFVHSECELPVAAKRLRRIIRVGLTLHSREVADGDK